MACLKNRPEELQINGKKIPVPNSADTNRLSRLWLSITERISLIMSNPWVQRFRVNAEDK